jgi:hypothetical protein
MPPFNKYKNVRIKDRRWKQLSYIPAEGKEHHLVVGIHPEGTQAVAPDSLLEEGILLLLHLGILGSSFCV